MRFLDGPLLLTDSVGVATGESGIGVTGAASAVEGTSDCGGALCVAVGAEIASESAGVETAAFSDSCEGGAWIGSGVSAISASSGAEAVAPPLPLPLPLGRPRGPPLPLPFGGILAVLWSKRYRAGMLYFFVVPLIIFEMERSWFKLR